ncbi:MAG: amidohydrolase family protein [Actinomycetota bacterium]
MIIDCHNHVLGGGLSPGNDRFMRELTVSFFQSQGQLPADRTPTEEDWRPLSFITEPIDPDALLEAHKVVGVDRCAVLAVAPSDYTAYLQRGTVDLTGITGVPGEPRIEKANDYMEGLQKRYPDDMITVAAVNPRFRGPKAAVEELRRAAEELHLTAVKLYPMYDHYAVNDRDIAFPVFAAARDLGLPVMVHMATTPARDAPLELGRPILLDDVARAFPDLRILVAHAGFPWVDECFCLIGRHDNTYLDLSYMNSVIPRRDHYDFLHRARRYGCNWTRICWGTDYPCFELPETLLPKLTLVNDEATEDEPIIPTEDLARMVGGNYARFLGTDWSLAETVEQFESLEETWRKAWAEKGTG